MDRIYFTTPIYYVNAQPHLGHTYTTILADTLKRYHRSRGRDAYFLTGTDEHGDKIAQAAAKDDIDPKAYADRISALFRSTWDTCGFAYDHFIRTTDDYHKATVSRILQQIYDAGDIYFGGVRRILLLRLRALLHREGTAGRQVPGPSDRGSLHPGRRTTSSAWASTRTVSSST